MSNTVNPYRDSLASTNNTRESETDNDQAQSVQDTRNNVSITGYTNLRDVEESTCDKMSICMHVLNELFRNGALGLILKPTIDSTPSDAAFAKKNIFYTSLIVLGAFSLTGSCALMVKDKKLKQQLITLCSLMTAISGSVAWGLAISFTFNAVMLIGFGILIVSNVINAIFNVINSRKNLSESPVEERYEFQESLLKMLFMNSGAQFSSGILFNIVGKLNDNDYILSSGVLLIFASMLNLFANIK